MMSKDFGSRCPEQRKKQKKQTKIYSLVQKLYVSENKCIT
jgi:hypothetical protein